MSYQVRIPSLFEIFFGKLANWFRRLAEWRKQGLLKKALQGARQRRAMRLETLEPRVLLSADLSYTGLVTDLTLKGDAVTVGDETDYFLRLYDSSNLGGPALQSEELVLADDVDINISREFASGALFGDTVRLDLDTFSLLNAFVNSNGGELHINFDGGSELVFNDQVRLEGGDTATIGYGLEVA